TCIEQIDWHNRRGITGTLIGRSESWGQGIGGELMHLRADFAFTQLPLNKLSSAYLEGNEASRRAQLAAGYKEIGRCRQEFFREGRWVDRVLTELLREEWLTLQDDH
ncbi:MAG: GNAT family N-acetyltransferase, partial [Candidatus Dormibacteraceae bacterium]